MTENEKIPLGRFFSIKNNSNGLALEVPVAAYEVHVAPKTPLYMWTEKTSCQGNDSQLWYEDKATETIRSRLNGFCLEIDNGSLVVNAFNSSNSGQRWTISGNRLVNSQEPSLVLDLANQELGGAVVLSKPDNSSTTQQWTIERALAVPFYIVSQLNGKVLDVYQSKSEPGTTIIMFQKKKKVEENQLWYEDMNGILRSRLTGFALAPDSKNYMTCQPYEPKNPLHQWLIGESGVIRNLEEEKKVLDIWQAKKKDCTPVICHPYHGDKNQLWTLDPVHI